MTESKKSKQIDPTGRISLLISCSALLISLFSFVYQYFWHSQNLVVSVFSVQVIDGNLKTKLAFSNLGNQDEVINDIFYTYDIELDNIPKATLRPLQIFKDFTLQNSFVVKSGQSIIYEYNEPLFGIGKLKENTWGKVPIALDINLLSVGDIVPIKFALIDGDTNYIHYNLAEKNLHSANKTIYGSLDPLDSTSYQGFFSLPD